MQSRERILNKGTKNRGLLEVQALKSRKSGGRFPVANDERPFAKSLLKSPF